jgi:hypothetical protein
MKLEINKVLKETQKALMKLVVDDLVEKDRACARYVHKDKPKLLREAKTLYDRMADTRHLKSCEAKNAAVNSANAAVERKLQKKRTVSRKKQRNAKRAETQMFDSARANRCICAVGNGEALLHHSFMCDNTENRCIFRSAVDPIKHVTCIEMKHALRCRKMYKCFVPHVADPQDYIRSLSEIIEKGVQHTFEPGMCHCIADEVQAGKIGPLNYDVATQTHDLKMGRESPCWFVFGRILGICHSYGCRTGDPNHKCTMSFS